MSDGVIKGETALTVESEVVGAEQQPTTYKSLFEKPTAETPASTAEEDILDVIGDPMKMRDLIPDSTGDILAEAIQSGGMHELLTEKIEAFVKDVEPKKFTNHLEAVDIKGKQSITEKALERTNTKSFALGIEWRKGDIDHIETRYIDALNISENKQVIETEVKAKVEFLISLKEKLEDKDNYTKKKGVSSIRLGVITEDEQSKLDAIYSLNIPACTTEKLVTAPKSTLEGLDDPLSIDARVVDLQIGDDDSYAGSGDYTVALPQEGRVWKHDIQIDERTQTIVSDINDKLGKLAHLSLQFEETLPLSKSIQDSVLAKPESALTSIDGAIALHPRGQAISIANGELDNKSSAHRNTVDNVAAEEVSLIDSLAAGLDLGDKIPLSISELLSDRDTLAAITTKMQEEARSNVLARVGEMSTNELGNIFNGLDKYGIPEDALAQVETHVKALATYIESQDGENKVELNTAEIVSLLEIQGTFENSEIPTDGRYAFTMIDNTGTLRVGFAEGWDGDKVKVVWANQGSSEVEILPQGELEGAMFLLVVEGTISGENERVLEWLNEEPADIENELEIYKEMINVVLTQHAHNLPPKLIKDSVTLEPYIVRGMSGIDHVATWERLEAGGKENVTFLLGFDTETIVAEYDPETDEIELRYTNDGEIVASTGSMKRSVFFSGLKEDGTITLSNDTKKGLILLGVGELEREESIQERNIQAHLELSKKVIAELSPDLVMSSEEVVPNEQFITVLDELREIPLEDDWNEWHSAVLDLLRSQGITYIVSGSKDFETREEDLVSLGSILNNEANPFGGFYPVLQGTETPVSTVVGFIRDKVNQ